MLRAVLSSVHLRSFSLLPLFVISLLASTASGLERIAVDHSYVAAAAQKRAASPYQKGNREVPRFFRELNYDAYRRITFQPDTSLWRDDTGLQFQLQFYHPGYLFAQMVKLNEFTETHSQPIPFSRNFFDYHDISIPLVSRWGLDFAGFRLLHPLNAADRWDEVISFLGASYHRALAKNQAYGVSARGIAINAGGPGDEEFPAFVEFWIRKPEPNATTVTIHALLDGPSVAGAFTYVVTPGADTVVETKATLFFRKAITTTGFIPLSSMFWFGENSPTRHGDFRPEVHDSDGLLIATDSQNRLWRPLNNPSNLMLTDFEAPNFAGFGLLQRDRSFRTYEDLEAHYQRRPGVWIEPIGKFPEGKVRLIETPTKDEFQDNVSVVWMPKEAIAPGKPFEIAWREHWTFAPVFGGPRGWVAATRQTVQDGAADRTKFVIDYDPSSLADITANTNLVPEVKVTNGGKVLSSQLVYKQADGARRLIVALQAPVGGGAVEIQARLMLDGRPVTETWITRWQP